MANILCFNLRLDGYWKEIAGYSFKEEFGLFIADPSKHDKTRIEEIIVCQPGIVSHEIALTKLYEHWGIKCDMYCGHSLGEVRIIFTIKDNM